MFEALYNCKEVPGRTETRHLPYQNQMKSLKRNDLDVLRICDRKRISSVFFA